MEKATRFPRGFHLQFDMKLVKVREKCSCLNPSSRISHLFRQQYPPEVTRDNLDFSILQVRWARLLYLRPANAG